MRFTTLDLALEAQQAVARLIKRVQRHDRKLAQQLRDATNSFLLNLGESAHSDPGTRRSRYQNAAGSTSEVLVGLRVSVGWGVHQRRGARSRRREVGSIARLALEADALKEPRRRARRGAESSLGIQAAARRLNPKSLASWRLGVLGAIPDSLPAISLRMS
jgi:phage gp37-like protein